eukprot:gene22840-45697_t
MAKKFCIDEEELLLAHPKDIQVLLDGELLMAKTTAIKATAERLLACLPFRSQDPDLRRMIDDYGAKHQIPKRLELGLKALDSQGIRAVLGHGQTKSDGALLMQVVAEQDRMKDNRDALGCPWFASQAQEDHDRQPDEEQPATEEKKLQQEQEERAAQQQLEEKRRQQQ